MDFNLSSKDEGFRQEVRQFLTDNWDTKGYDSHSINVRSYDFATPEARDIDNQFIQKLVEKGWYTMHWPEEWGGEDASFGKQFVYMEGQTPNLPLF